MTLHSQLNLALQFRRQGQSVLFKIKIKLIEMFELHKRMPGMRSAEYQVTVPLKFFIIIHNYANVWTINQSKSLPGFRLVSDVTGRY